MTWLGVVDIVCLGRKIESGVTCAAVSATWIAGPVWDPLRCMKFGSFARAIFVYKETCSTTPMAILHFDSPQISLLPFSCLCSSPSLNLIPNPDLLLPVPRLMASPNKQTQKIFEPTPQRSMANANFHLECFRPWNPSQEKGQRNRLDTCRYPSPVSISATPFPSDPTDPIPQSQNSYAPRPERHPLPVRPPVEVCVDGSLQPKAQITQHETEMLRQTPSTNPDTEIFDWEGSSLHSDSLPSSDNVDHTMFFDHIVQNPENESPSPKSGDLDLAFTPDPHFQVEILGSPIQTGVFSNFATIDPAILGSSHSQEVEQAQAIETTSGFTTPPDIFLAEPPRILNEDAPFDGRQHTVKRTLKSGWQPSKISKVSVVVKSHKKSRAGRSIDGLGRQNVSFSTARAQFSALPVEDRLQFLSWLFEGALSQCLQMPSGTNDASASTCVSGQDEVSTPRSEHTTTSAGMAGAKRACSSRKGLKWSAEEDRLLVKLRVEEKLAWPEVTKRFGRVFPGRKQGSLQVYWSTKLSKQRR